METIKQTSIIFLLLLVSFCGRAQQYRFVPFAGYALDESFDFAGKQGLINANIYYGGIFEYRIKSNYSIELMFQREETETEFPDPVNPRVIQTALSWYMIGGVNYHQLGQGKFSTIAGLYAGVGNVANQDNKVNEARFTAGLKAGIVYDISRSIGFRVQPQVLLMLGGPGSVWGVDNAGTYGTIVQMGFTGGLVFSFGNKKLTKPGENI